MNELLNKETKVSCSVFPERVQRPRTSNSWVGQIFSQLNWWLSIDTHNDACEGDCRDAPYRKIYDSDGSYTGMVLGNSRYNLETWVCCWVVETFSQLPPEPIAKIMCTFSLGAK